MKELIRSIVKDEIYFMPTEVIFGRGALAEIGMLPQVQEKTRVVLVSGGHFRETEDFKLLISIFSAQGKEVVVYEPRETKSDFGAINRLVNFLRKEKPDLVIGVGGGTIIDTAKCGTILAVNQGKVEDYVREKKKELKKKGVTFVAVPTTAGTGSEVTPWATVWDTQKKKKYSLTSPLMFPAVAVVDPALTDSLPPKITAETGIDALAQAIEAYWSVNHNSVSDKYALEAIGIALGNLEKAVNRPDKKSRDKMAKAALLAGLAFSNTQTTICHALSYPMTAYWNIPHGQAVAISLPAFIEYTLPVLGEREKVLLQVLKTANEKEAARKVRLLMEKIGLATRLSQLGIKKTDIDLIVKEGFHSDRAKNAPRIPTSEELREILEEIL